METTEVKEPINNNNTHGVKDNAHNKEAQPAKQKKVKLNFNADVYKRLNFLHQAAMLSLPHDEGLSRFYMETMKSVAQRNVIRLDPSVKNTMCHECSSLLVPGLSSSVRFNAARDSHMTVTCQHCHAQARRRTKHVKKPRKTSTQLEHVTVEVMTRVGEITVPVKHASVKPEPAQSKAPSKKQLKRQRALQKREDEAKNSTEASAVTLAAEETVTRVKDNTEALPTSEPSKGQGQ